MAAFIELKYYNSFWLKKIKAITDVTPTVAPISREATSDGTTLTLTTGVSATQMNVGQAIKIDYPTDQSYNGFITKRTSETEFKLSEAPSPVISGTTTITLGEIEDFTNIPQAYADSEPDGADSGNWYIEESRIRGGYNNTSVDLGAKAFIVDEVKNGETRVNSLIYSGIYNSRTGTNNTNQFSVGEDITKSLDPVNGSIQKLYAEDTNLVIFQENKVSRALIDKDAIYSAEGSPVTTSSNLVIGQVQPYAGNYGISDNPESFAVYGYRKYFVDRYRNSVMRLSQDGLTEISNYGMMDYFRDTLGVVNGGKIIGGWDTHNKQYVVSIQDVNIDDVNPSTTGDTGYNTLSFDESVTGWTSFFNYKPQRMFSLKNNFYSIKNNSIWKHYQDTDNNLQPIKRGSFYGDNNYENTKTSIEFIFNPSVSASKVFKTVNYEGGNGWKIESIQSDITNTILPTGVYANVIDSAKPIHSYDEGSYIYNNTLYRAGFNRKENKYHANIVNNSGASAGEVVWGESISGIKGRFVTVNISTDETTEPGGPKELFAVSAEYAESSY